MNDEPRIDQILDMVVQLASGRMDTRLHTDGTGDELDAVITGLNMLAQELEAERDALGQRLEHADKLAVLGQLASGVAHDINNPLAYMLCNLEEMASLVDRETWGSELVDLIAETREGAERVQRIVKGLDGYSRMEIGRREPLDLRRVVRAAIEMSANEIRHRCQLVEHYHAIPPVFAHEGRLVQAFANLLINALQALPEGRVESNEIRVTIGSDDASEVVVTVTDSGAGMSADEAAHIFEPYFHTDGARSSRGLGLFVCHGIVTGHGGTVQVSSAPGDGTTFTVRLPASLPSDANTGETPAAAERSRVLIVDDEPLVARALARLLGRDHEVVVMDNGAELLGRLDAGAHFDVIFCDLMMPEMTGIELFDRVKEASPSLASRMVFMTGGAFTASAHAFVEAPQRLVIRKPFDAQRVRDLVAELTASS